MVKTTRTAVLIFVVFSFFADVWLEPILFFLVGATIVMKRVFLDLSPVAEEV